MTPAPIERCREEDLDTIAAAIEHLIIESASTGRRPVNAEGFVVRLCSGVRFSVSVQIKEIPE